jgi:two-component system, OmpR family, response regulator
VVSACTPERELRMPHVLLVDDHADLRDVVSELLTMNGHTVTCAVSAEEARTLLARSGAGEAPFEVVIADQNLSGESGLDLLTELAALGRYVTVLASGDDHHRPRVLAAGIDDFWVKGSDAFFDRLSALDDWVAERRGRNA